MGTNDGARQIELLETVRKKRAALEARLRKEPYTQIADKLSVSVETVRCWVKEMTVTMLPQEEIEELRAQEAAGWDDLQQRAYQMIDMLNIQAARKIEADLNVAYETEQIRQWQEHIGRLKESRAKLLGIQVPVKVNHAVTVRTQFDEEVEALVSDLLGGGMVMSQPTDVDTGSEDI